MKGRVLNVKKTTILKVSFLINLLLFVGLSVLSVVVYAENDNYFYLFCLLYGFHLVLKSALFRLDSACYMGSILFFVGGFYFYCQCWGLMAFWGMFVVLSFGIGSFLTHCFFDRPLQLVFAISLFFVSISLFLLMINLISLSVFLAICFINVLLLTIKSFRV